MNGFYSITAKIHEVLREQGFQVITLGDYLKVDLQKQTIYPLAHVVPVTSTLGENTTDFTFVIIGMDLVDFNKDALRDQESPFFGTDNLQDVLNDIHNRLNQTAEIFKRGPAFDDLIRVEVEPSLDPFFERYENLLAGWELTAIFKVPNQATIC